MKTRTIITAAVLATLLVFTNVLLGSDAASFLRWYLGIAILGLGFYPLGKRLFSRFEDQGWLFSKVIAIALSGFVTWVLVVCGVLKFHTIGCIMIPVIMIAVFWYFEIKNKKTHANKETEKALSIDLVFWEEILFLGFFLIWAYFFGFNAQAMGTEKFMDYGFMKAMMNSESLPAIDMWYSQKPINYYYGGQYYAVYLTKLTFTEVKITYNLMRAMIAGLAFAMPFALVYQMLRDSKAKQAVSVFGGVAAGAALSLAGNIHYVLYGLFGKVFRLSGYEDYWFPSSTRYIGHNPETNDACIHEFPSYSFVLGDLHAHMINIFFVLLELALLYSYLKEVWKIKTKEKPFSAYLKETLLRPQLVMAAIMVGIFKWTNYWDFIIYLTVIFFAVVIAALKMNGRKISRVLLAIILPMIMTIVISIIAALPFTSSFETMISGVALCKNHSALYQLLILWGLPLACVILLVIFVLVKSVKTCGENNVKCVTILKNISLPDYFAILMGICAIGLILIPEIVYVVDIYEDGYSRSNTMFKLTYQAYMMFAICMGYGFARIFFSKAKKWLTILMSICFFFFILTLGYFPYAVSCWFGDVGNKNARSGLDAEAYLEYTYPTDAEAIRFLEEEINGRPVVLEASGSSYSDHCRVSAMTGLPTPLGWYVHEWLWRSDPADLNQISSDIDAIYTSTDAARVKELLNQYNISYIFVGSKEWEEYPDLNEDLLMEMGDVVFSGTVSDALYPSAYVIRVK